MTPKKKLTGMDKRITKGLTDQDVARFLRQLVTIYKDRRSGNPALAEALRKLAERLEQESSATRASVTKKVAISPKLSLDELKSFDGTAILGFLDDNSRTKADLIELAFARFSIPRSKLQRMPISEIRESVRAAFKHEQSLRIISEEAERYGTNRRS